MNLKTYLTGTRKEIKEDLEEKIITPTDAIKNEAIFGGYGIAQSLAGAALLYIGQNIMPEAVPPVLDAIGLVAMLDPLQRIIYGMHQGIKYMIPNPKNEETTKNAQGFVKNLIKGPGIVGWTKEYGEWVEKRQKEKENGKNN